MKKNLTLFCIIVVAVVVGLIAYRMIDQALTEHQQQIIFEANAVGTFRTFRTALLEYSTTCGKFPASLQQFGPNSPATEEAADLVDYATAQGILAGYHPIGYSRTDGVTYQLWAVSATGGRNFFTDQTGIIRIDSASGREWNDR